MSERCQMRRAANTVGPGFTHLVIRHPFLQAFSTAFTAPGYDHSWAEQQFAAAHQSLKTGALHDLTKPEFPREQSWSDEAARGAHEQRTDEWLREVSRQSGLPHPSSFGEDEKDERGFPMRNRAHWDLDAAWQSGIRKGLTHGHIDIGQARERGYSSDAREMGQEHYDWDTREKTYTGGWRPMPERMYHVSTDADAVAREGLKTRRELGQDKSHGHGSRGLGGGPDDTVSVTSDPRLGPDIYHALHEHHAVVTGKIPMRRLVEYSEHPPVGQPFREGFEARAASPEGFDTKLDAIDRGVKQHEGMRPPERSEYSNPADEAEWRVTGHIPDGPLAGRPSHWERDLHPGELHYARSEVYKAFSGARHRDGGGHRDPLFLSNDPRAFAQTDPARFGILHLRTHPGGQGWTLRGSGEHHDSADSGEWRTGGSPFDVEKIERPRPRHLDEFGLDKTSVRKGFGIAAQTAISHGVRLFHGTDVDLGQGDTLLPGGQVGRKNHELSWPDTVYLSPDPGAARVHAENFARPGHRPRVYEVHSPLARPDSTDLVEQQWTAPHAQVAREVPDHEVDLLSDRFWGDDEENSAGGPLLQEPLGLEKQASVESEPFTSSDALDEHLQRVFQPQQLDARREPHPKSGYPVNVGLERRLDRSEIPDWPHGEDLDLARHSAPARFQVLDHGPDAEHRHNWGMKPNLVGHEPIQHVYRGVSMDEYRQARQRGYIDSDRRGVIAAGEGTNAATEPRTAISYLPTGQGMVMKIKARPEHDWRVIRPDEYVRTGNRIPMSDVEHAEPFTKDEGGGLYAGHHDQDTVNRIHRETRQRWRQQLMEEYGPNGTKLGQRLASTGGAPRWDPVSHPFDPACACCSPTPGSFQHLGAHEVRADAPAPHPNPTGMAHWYHGTTFEPERSDSGRDPGGELDPDADWEGDSDLELSANGRGHKHWNTDFGTHFTGLHHVAMDSFAKGGNGRVAHASLHMANPKTYASEHDMDHEAVRWALDHGHRFLPTGPDSSMSHMHFRNGNWDRVTNPHHESDPDYGPDYDDHYEAMGSSPIAPNEGVRYGISEIDRNGPYRVEQHDAGYQGTAFNEQWLRHHPHRGEIVNGFEQHLREQGHDGIVYGNQFEGPKGHPCAIAFRDTPVTLHHWEWRDNRKFAKQAVQSPPEGLYFTDDQFDTGGSKYPTRVHLRAHLPEEGQVGALIYHPPRRRNGIVQVHNLAVQPEYRRRGVASALMDEMQRRHPESSIDHGDRTWDGEDWWKGYTEGRPVRRGRTAGWNDEPGEDDYRMQHRPPGRDDGMPIHDLTQNLPADVYTHPHYYSDMTEPSNQVAHDVLRRVRGRPEAKVRIYRALPAEHAHQGFRPGDWVSTSREYAINHGKHSTDPKHDWPVIRTTVRADDLHTDGDDLREYGYNGETVQQGQVSFKGGYHQEVRQHADGVIRPVKRRQGPITGQGYSFTMEQPVGEQHGTVRAWHHEDYAGHMHFNEDGSTEEPQIADEHQHVADELVRRMKQKVPRPPRQPKQGAAEDYTYEHKTNDAGTHHYVNAYDRSGERVGDMTWHAGSPHHVTWVAVYDEENRRKGIGTGMWNKAREVDPQVKHNDTEGGQTDAGAAWARKVGSREMLPQAMDPKPGMTIYRGEVRHADDLPHPPSVGMHWTLNPDQAILGHPQSADPASDERRVLWKATLDDPATQAIPRSHPIWQGKHRSMDSEAEIRLRPGARVRLTGYKDVRPGTGSWDTPEQEIDHHATVEHNSTTSWGHEYAHEFPDLFTPPGEHYQGLRVEHDTHEYDDGGKLHTLTVKHPNGKTVGWRDAMVEPDGTVSDDDGGRVNPGHEGRGVEQAMQSAWARHFPHLAAKQANGAPMLDLYHRTTPQAAEVIMRERRMVSKENTQEAYFSTHRDGAASTDYGDGVVHVRVPEHLAELDDEFPDGEQHYRVRVKDLRPHHFVSDHKLAAGMPARTAAESGFAEGNQFAQRLDDTEENEPYIVPRFDEYARDYTAPTGHQYRLLHGVGGLGANTQVTAHQRLSNGKYRGVGYLSWFSGKPTGSGSNVDGGVIYKAHVSAPHRRRGLATAMLNFAREKHPEQDIRHSTALSDDGRAWSEKVGAGSLTLTPHLGKASARGDTRRHGRAADREAGVGGARGIGLGARAGGARNRRRQQPLGQDPAGDGSPEQPEEDAGLLGLAEHTQSRPGERHFGEETHGGADQYLDHLRGEISQHGLREPLEVGHPTPEGVRAFGPGPHLTDGNHRGVIVHELGIDPVPVRWLNKQASVQMVRPSDVWDYVRPDLRPHRLQTVTDSIREHGYQPDWDHADGPVKVDLTGETPRIGNGSHRLRALHDLGLNEPIPMHVTGARQMQCSDCGGTGTEHNPERTRSWDCRRCSGSGTFHASDGWDPPELPKEQAEALHAEDHSTRRRKSLDLARNPVPGTHLWRGEVRHKDDVDRPPSVGMHWSTKPEMAIGHHVNDPDHRRVVWQARLDDPAAQTIPRSHPIWYGDSLDSEAEVRLRPGKKVHLTGVYVDSGERQGQTSGYTPSPFHPDRSAANWSYHPIGEHVPVEHHTTLSYFENYPERFPDLFRQAALGLRQAMGIHFDKIDPEVHRKLKARGDVMLHASDVAFEPGDVVSPASARGGQSAWSHLDTYSPDHVYGFKAHEIKKNWRLQGDTIYHVEPHGEPEPDPEGQPGSYRFPSAVVRGVVHDGWQRGLTNYIPEGLRGPNWEPRYSERPPKQAARAPRQAAAVPPAERTESVAHMLAHYRPTDFDTWDEVRDNFDWDHPKMRAFVEDVRRNGVRRPIPVDYEQDPPRVMNGHTRLLAAEKAGRSEVPTRQHEGWMDPDDPDHLGNGPDDPEHWSNKWAALDSRPVRYYHATNRPLSGDTLLPFSQTGRKSYSRQRQRGHPDYSPDHVYVYAAEGDSDVSAHLANGHHGAHVYEVEPSADLHPDPEPGSDCYRASSAKILRKAYSPGDPWVKQAARTSYGEEYPDDGVWYHKSHSPQWDHRPEHALHVGTGHAATYMEDQPGEMRGYLHCFRYHGTPYNTPETAAFDQVANHAYHEAFGRDASRSHSDSMDAYGRQFLDEAREMGHLTEDSDQYVDRHIQAAKQGLGIHYTNGHEGDRPTISLVAPSSHFEHLGVEPITPEHRQRFAALDLRDVRVLNPTTGHDPDLFDGEQLKESVRKELLRRWTVFCARHGLADWSSWAKLFFSGGEASEWSGPGSNPNGDFDLHVGIRFDVVRQRVPQFAGLSDEEISAQINDWAWTDFNDHDFHPGGTPRVFDLTLYSNPAVRPDITAIKPYAAYDVLDNTWAVHPEHYATAPHLPAGVRKALQGAERYARQVLALPEPQRTREAAVLFESWHADRNAAFGPDGAGVFDYANLRMKALESTGTWQELQAAANRLAGKTAASPSETEHVLGRDIPHEPGQSRVEGAVESPLAPSEEDHPHFHMPDERFSFRHVPLAKVISGQSECDRGRHGAHCYRGENYERTGPGSHDVDQPFFEDEASKEEIARGPKGHWRGEPFYRDDEDYVHRLTRDAHKLPALVIAPAGKSGEFDPDDHGGMYGGGHRTAAWNDAGYTHVPAWVHDSVVRHWDAAGARRPGDHLAGKTAAATEPPSKYFTLGSMPDHRRHLLEYQGEREFPLAGLHTDQVKPLSRQIIDRYRDDPGEDPVTIHVHGGTPWMENGHHRAAAAIENGESTVWARVYAEPLAGKTAAMDATDYEGEVGNPTHITRGERGELPIDAVRHMRGARGELPGEHRNRQGQAWEDFKADIAANGVRDPIFITVDHDEAPKLSEGSHRRDAVVELGLSHIPAEVRYFGHAERQGTVEQRAGLGKQAGAAGPDYDNLIFRDIQQHGEQSLEAHHPDHGLVGRLVYRGPYGDRIDIGNIRTPPEHRRRGVATQLMTELEHRYPGHTIDHGARSFDGAMWADSKYGPDATTDHWDDDEAGFRTRPTLDGQVVKRRARRPKQAAYEHDPLEDQECEDCGGAHATEDCDEQGSHHTDWDRIWPHISDVHRGINVGLPHEVHQIVHDPARPVDERAHALLRHLQAHPHGMHWTDSPEQAEHYTTAFHGEQGTPVVISGRKPDRDWVEEDPDSLRDARVIGYDLHDDREVPLQSHAPVAIHTIAWGDHGAHELTHRHHFEQPLTVHASTAAQELRYVRNNGGMRQMAAPDDFDQQHEPWGRYYSPHGGIVPPGWESGAVRFQNPLHVDWEDGGWKRRLSEQYGGRTGKELSQALLDAGHDAVVTHDHEYGPMEFVDIRPKGQREHRPDREEEAQSG